MSKRWSKLQKKIYCMIDPNLDWQIHCMKYRVPGHSGMQEFPRYFVTLNGKIIFDWPKAYPLGEGPESLKLDLTHRACWRACEITEAIIEYLEADTQKQMTLKDPWGIIDIVRAADRRIGRRRWDQVFAISNSAGREILLARKAAKQSKP